MLGPQPKGITAIRHTSTTNTPTHGGLLGGIFIIHPSEPLSSSLSLFSATHLVNSTAGDAETVWERWGKQKGREKKKAGIEEGKVVYSFVAAGTPTQMNKRVFVKFARRNSWRASTATKQPPGEVLWVGDRKAGLALYQRECDKAWRRGVCVR